MKELKAALPAYPLKNDLWDELKKETRPIVIYGMGNGADKLIDKLSELQIEYSDIFASDGFVRGHSFRGKRVKSFSEIKAEYRDFLILLSFASNKADVIDMLEKIDNEYSMRLPDMPVAGVDEYFTKNFYNEHYKEILKAYETLSDEASREIFSGVINYKLTGRIKYLLTTYSQKDEMYSLLPIEKIRVAIDAGAYNGDTAREMKEYFKNLKTIYAIEPDQKNYKKLAKYSEAENEIDIKTFNAAVWCESGVGEFSGSGNRNSTLTATASYEHKDVETSLITIDEFREEAVDYIKYDVEGAEREALIGSENIIREKRPSMLISLYHRSRDIFEIINDMNAEYPDYNFYLRRLRCLPAWELNLLMIPK